MDFQEKGGRWLKAQSLSPTYSSSCVSIWQILGQNTQTHSPKGRHPALPGTPAVFLFQM